jgi:hypothetical protein
MPVGDFPYQAHGCMGVCMDFRCARYGCQRTAPCQPYQVAPQPGLYPPGCICPPTSEKTCENHMCPRKGVKFGATSTSTQVGASS